MILGLDVGGTNIKAVLLDSAQRPQARSRWRTAAMGSVGAAILPQLESHILDFLARQRLEVGDLAGLGLACAGLVNSETGRLENAPNLRAWEGLQLGDWLRSRFPCPVALDNDVNSLAYGEWRLGAGRGVRHMLCLALGTGVGGGLILDGRIYRGRRGLAGELGHLCIDRNGRRCACGCRGCLEAYAGAVAIRKAAHRALARKRRGHGELARRLGGREPEPAALVRAARDGSGLARELLDEVGRALGVAIGSLINVFAPERVVLAGGVARAGNLLLEPARREIPLHLMEPRIQRCQLRLRALGDDGAAMGAALLAQASPL